MPPADMATMANLRHFGADFTGHYHYSSFAYVLLPFLRVFKYLGYAPIKLKGGEILRDPCHKLEWDWAACAWTLMGSVLYIVGFVSGVQQISFSGNFERLHDSSVIAYFTSWAQIVVLFLLASGALVTSWTNIDKMRALCSLIFTIDQRLRSIDDTIVDYRRLRRRLTLQFGVAFLVPICLSMVNCIIIQPMPEQFSMFSSCYLFICFAPMLLLTFKEFQFYNLLHVLESKFEIVNEKLRSYAIGRQSMGRIRNIQSVCEISLTATRLDGDSVDSMPRQASAEQLEQFLVIYTLIADAVELVMAIFAWHLLLMTTASFGVITIQSYNLFALIVHSLSLQIHQIVFVVAWILVQVLTIGINVSACSRTAKTMSDTGPLLHKIRLQLGQESSFVGYQVLQLFSLEVLQRKHSLTAAGYFDMDYKLITSIIAAVTTYLVIIIQFHLSSNDDCHHNGPQTPSL